MKKTIPFWMLCLVIFFVSAIPIVYKFNGIPKNLTLDEVEFAHLTMLLRNAPYTVYSTYATGHATLYFYILLGFFNLFGVSQFVLRLPAAIFGWVNGVLVFFILYSTFSQSIWDLPAGRQARERQAPQTWILIITVMSAFLYIFCRWQFQFARFAFEATFLQMLELISLLSIFWFIKTRRAIFLYSSALFAGLCFHSYIPGRIFFIVPLTTLVVYMKKDMRRYAALFLLVWAVVISPLQIYLFQNPDIRVHQQSYLTNPKISTSKKVRFLGENIASTAGMFALRGDVNGRHNYPNKPALNVSILMLSLLGALHAVRTRQRIGWVFVVYFIVALIPTVLTYPSENPNMLRTVTAVPSIIYFATLGLYSCIEWFEARRLKAIGVGLCTLLVAFSIFYDWRTYFTFQSKVFKESFEINNSLNYHLNQSARPSL